MTGPQELSAYLRDPAPVLAFAHRGGALHPDITGLENTVKAFRHATDLGYRYLETDVHLTSDGELLAFHDEVLERVTDHDGVVAESTIEILRNALIGGREAIPTLGELFDEFPEAKFNIDIKAAAAVRPLAEFIAQRRVWDRVLVGSFSPGRLREFRRLTGGRVATSAHPWEVVAYRLLPSARLARRATPGRPAALQVPHHRGPVRVVTPGFVRRAHAAGLHVHVWTIDSADEMHELIDTGVDGIMTDRTDTLKHVLQQRGLWKDQP